MADEFNPDELLSDIDKIMMQQGYGPSVSSSEPIEIEANNIAKPESFTPSEEIMSRIDSAMRQEEAPATVSPQPEVGNRAGSTFGYGYAPAQEPTPAPTPQPMPTPAQGSIPTPAPQPNPTPVQASIPTPVQKPEDDGVSHIDVAMSREVPTTPVSERTIDPIMEEPSSISSAAAQSEKKFTTIEDPMDWHLEPEPKAEAPAPEPVDDLPPVSYLEGASSSGVQVENVAFGDISVGVETESVEYNVGHPLLRLFRNILIIVAAALLLSLLITKFVAHHTAVDGSSMSNTLSDGDQLIVQQVSYYFHDPERFDIVVFPISTEDNYIKRVIGLPGETVQIIDGQVYINGSLLADDRYGMERIQDPGMAADMIYLKNDEYFVLGDNRNASVDSRFPEVGVIKKQDIKAKAWLRFYPFGDFGFVN